jgi:hypothetical protein
MKSIVKKLKKRLKEDMNITCKVLPITHAMAFVLIWENSFVFGNFG